MLFPTATFALFFLVVLPLSWLTMPWPHRWRPFIIVASYVFYGWWDWRFVFLLAGCTLWNQVLAVRIWRSRSQSQRQRTALLALAGNLGVLGYFKYYDFFVSSTDNMASIVGLDLPLSLKSVVLPVGISFYTFMAISYVVDAYRGEFEPTTLEKFAVYLSFFPHLVAGPIVRPSELIPQIETPRNPRRVDTSRAFYLIATGLFKKVVIANYLASSIVDEVFAAPGQHSSLEILIAIYAYAVQIYADFSGYTDIAIGIALLLGFTFPQNFDSPYAATSRPGLLAALAHDALALAPRLPLHPARRQPARSADDVSQPDADDADRRPLARRGVDLRRLGRSPRPGPRLERWWHGAARAGDAPRSTRSLWLARIATFHFVCFAWIFFRSDSFGAAWDMIEGLFTGWGEASPLVTGGVLLAIAVGIGSQYLPARIPRIIMARFSRLPVLGQATVLALALMLTSVLGPEGVAPFIYFQF